MKNRPLLIVISSNRNYGWVVHAFLKANSQWADYIVIVDQMSTDGSREMYAQYENVIVVDDVDMAFKENTRAKMAFVKGRELAAGRDAIYFALDIDEVLPSNWLDTNDGARILNSTPGDMFQLIWANINPDKKTYWKETPQYKIFHDNGMEWQSGERELHAPHLPYSTYDVAPTIVKDFPNLHFGHYNKRWRVFNEKYYSVLDVHQHRSKSIISVNRAYNYPELLCDEHIAHEIKKKWLYDFDIFELVNINVQPLGVRLIKELIIQDGIEKYRCVDIWDEETCRELQVADPRTIGWKILHWYLRESQPYKNAFIVRAIDKVLKQFV